MDILQGTGEMAQRIREFDWATTPLGPIERWPNSLRTVVDLMLCSTSMMSLVWGPQAIHLYNDAFAELLREHTAQSLGRSAFDTFAHWSSVFADDIAAGLAGRSGHMPEQRYPVLRQGKVQEIWFDANYAPVRNEKGDVAGVLWTLSETTDRRRAEAALQESEADLRDKQAWLQAQKEAFQAAMNGASLETSLNILVECTVRYFGGDRRCAFYITSPDGKQLRHVVGMTSEYARTVEAVVVSPESLACGLAIATGKPVLTRDVLDEPRWEPWRWMARQFGYRGCWSFPLETAAGKVVGSFAMYFSEPREPDARDLELAEQLTQTAGIIVSRHVAAEERARAEAALREREADLARVQRIGEVGGLKVDTTSGMRSTRSPEYQRLHGLNSEQTEETHEQWRARVYPADRDDAEQALFTALAGTGSSYEGEYRIVRPSDGEVRWIHARADIERDDTGRAVRLVGAHVDVTEQKRLQAAIREREERLRSAVEVAGVGLWDWNVAQDTIHWSDEHFRMEGYAVGEVTPSYETWADRLHPEDRADTEAALRRSMDLHEDYDREFRVVHPDGSVHWLYGRGRFFYDPAGRPLRMIGAMVDVTARREWEERQKVMVAELQHRTRNLLGVVRSIAGQTRATSQDSLDKFFADFSDRLSALSRVQGLLSRSDQEPITIEAVVGIELDAMAGEGKRERVHASGPSVRLRPSIVQTLALAIHELATNARKYGALSNHHGQLDIAWHHTLQANEPWLVFEWHERDITPHQSTDVALGNGYGRQLIEKALPYSLNAKTQYELTPSELRCTVEVPLN